MLHNCNIQLLQIPATELEMAVEVATMAHGDKKGTHWRCFGWQRRMANSNSVGEGEGDEDGAHQRFFVEVTAVIVMRLCHR